MNHLDLELAWHSLAYRLGQKPSAEANFKVKPEDFFVDEVMGFEPDGEGEHLWLQIRKKDANTADVITRLSGLLKASPKVIGHSGLKDRWAVTQQWISVQLPGQDAPDLRGEIAPGVEVIAQQRHSKKLRPGTHKANRFEIRLRQVSDMAAAEEALRTVAQRGAPNYFGSQRFGHGGKNLLQAQALFAGKRIKSRNQKSMALSAARSLLFNRVASKRIESGVQPLAGECFMLSGTRSYFTADQIDDTIVDRLTSGDIQYSVPLWGKGELSSSSDAQLIEQEVVAEFAEFADGLVAQGLKQERRPLMIHPQQFSWQQQGDDLLLSFQLPTGCYATAVLREVVRFQE
ncbi:tRNA pseudouridine(13) synthase TruD [Corallincola holothuriorum]|uniref:tRNA pseudouridine synthase D n=1 Tax=Corallincola holothuriorum TaxID=2282215 RepID=A0A368NPP4_9GAMM|nr:tRNA pseudouridine(13) synthase TruD [Corallincola holothuriorum]RCU51873.1 tRNA pseudouridine(13) synthase TruD [Corallincola holothuriorum]